MARYIADYYTNQVPDQLKLLKTHDLDFRRDDKLPYGGLSTATFSETFPWNWFYYLSDNQVVDTTTGTRVVDLPSTIEGHTQLIGLPASDFSFNLVINNESAYYPTRHQMTKYNIPDLAYHSDDGALTLRTIRTNSNGVSVAMKDIAAGVFGHTHTVTAIDTANLTITVQGKADYWTRDSADSAQTYSVGDVRMGFGREFRDLLTSDSGEERARMLEWKYDVHEYGMLQLYGNGSETLKYFKIDDHDAVNGVDPISTNQVTTHTIHLLEAPTNWPATDGSASISLVKRLPFLSGCVTTQGAFSQSHGVWEFDIKLPTSYVSFPSIFLWGNYAEVFDEGISFDEKYKSTELDVIELISGDPRYVFFNGHSPAVDVQGMDISQGRTPVTTSPEWDFSSSHQTQLDQGLGSNLTDGKRARLRVYWYPDGAETYGKISNSVEYYMLDPTDSTYKMVAGYLAPEFWKAGQQLSNMQVQIASAVLGGFSNGLNFNYGKPRSTSPNILDYEYKIYSMQCFQFVGQTAGHFGFPQKTGFYDSVTINTPSPDDKSGGSGTGVVLDTNPNLILSDDKPILSYSETEEFVDSTQLPVYDYLPNKLSASYEIKLTLKDIIDNLGYFEPIDENNEATRVVVSNLLDLLEQAAHKEANEAAED